DDPDGSVTDAAYTDAFREAGIDVAASPPAKARWRKQAIDWFRADLAAWSKIRESGPPQAHQSIFQTLQHWKADPDLAGLR
ncbi:hypothetical protein, partial [Klebsiella pneumoniae]|uniref:hypothetical protein n=1 Tax=Klebsiella pneumoniae TaxID=573 RepID=UPI003013C766